MTIYTHFLYWIHLPHQTDITTEGYVGVSNNPKRRFSEHKNVSPNKNEGNKFFNNILNKYSSELLQTLIFQGTEKMCYTLEEELRPKKNIGWNANKGGSKPPSKKDWKPSKTTLEKRSTSLKGIPRNEVWCKNLSDAKLGTKNGMYGKKSPCTDERKVGIIRAKNKNKLDQLTVVFYMLSRSETIRNISKETGYSLSTIVSIKKNPKLYFEAFPILKKFETS